MAITILITSGPTREYIDPVRFISNASSGKMGKALVDEALKQRVRKSQKYQDYELWEMTSRFDYGETDEGRANAIRENTANIVKLNSVLDKTLKEADRKQQKHCEAIIDAGFKAFGFKILQECSAIIAHNKIDENKNLIIGNLGKVVSTEYYNLYSKLSAYEINEVNVASKLKEEWIKEVADNIIAIVYNGQDAITRITQINSRMTICINEYSTYINNKIFNT